MFELNQLRSFVVLAEELHFGRAAVRLRMTQPPLSRQILLLEHQLGVKLLERNSRSVRLTLTGRSFLREARAILRLAETASLEVRRIAYGEAGTVAIGFTAASGYHFLPRLIVKFRERLPEIDLMLKEMVTLEQIEALDAGRLDIALLRPHTANTDFETRRVVRETLVAALPQTHALARGRLPSLQDFDHAPFLTYSPVEARYFHDLVASTFARARVHPLYTQHVSQIHSILALVKAGLGAALVPEAAMQLRFEGVVFRPVREIRAQRPVELLMAWKRDNDNPALVKVLDSFEPSP